MTTFLASAATSNVSSLPDVIPALVLPPITRATLAMYAGAGGDDNPIHIDLDAARAAGLPDVFAHGMLSMAYVGRMLTNWVRPESIVSFSVRFRALTQLGDIVTCTGRIVEKFNEDNGLFARVDVQAKTQSDTVTLLGTAIVKIAS